MKVEWQDESPAEILNRIEKLAGQMAKAGWHYTHCQVDALLENLVLFFEKDEDELE